MSKESGTQAGAVAAAEPQNAAAQGGAATPPTTPATPPAQPAPETFFNPDGTMKPGWQQSSLVPDDFKGRKVYDAIGNDIPSFLRHIGHQDIVISKQGKGIFVPGPDATQTEKDVFNKAIGRPDTPQGYDEAIKSAIPKGMEEHYDDKDLIGALETVAYKHGATPALVHDLVAFDAARMAAAQKELDENPMPYYEDLLLKVQPIYKKTMEEELQKRWGDAYQSRKHLFQRAVAENTPEGEERELLLVNIERDPLFADLLATIMNKSFTSGMGPDTGSGSPGGAMNVDQRIDELMRDPNYADGRTNPGRHKYLVNEVQRLMASKHK
ncbi:MAG: hypothetical protein PHF37_03255 [Phycisphaerae bacterium]|jgi:hypothetical protein|nr:hypothetical protein [Phycisphaerae bacterium]